jgi:hypothetical protein
MEREQQGAGAVGATAGWIYQCSKGWAARCARSRGKRCRCACAGHNHGNKEARERTMELTDRRIFEQCDVEDGKLLSRAPIDGAFTFDREDANAVVRFQGVEFPQRWIVHSCGFEWGYGGSGPADLALNILGRFVTPRTAWLLHQDFKWQFIAPMVESGGSLSANAILGWLAPRLTRLEEEAVA